MTDSEYIRYLAQEFLDLLGIERNIRVYRSIGDRGHLGVMWTWKGSTDITYSRRILRTCPRKFWWILVYHEVAHILRADGVHIPRREGIHIMNPKHTPSTVRNIHNNRDHHICMLQAYIRRRETTMSIMTTLDKLEALHTKSRAPSPPLGSSYEDSTALALEVHRLLPLLIAVVRRVEVGVCPDLDDAIYRLSRACIERYRDPQHRPDLE